MTVGGNSAALSHVGRVRSNNQDSGYAGNSLFVVADGMGGHAGGDVASAVALRRIIEADIDYPTAQDAAAALQAAIIAANGQLTEAVFEHPELTGMGTTVDALVRVGDEVAIAHIGDSRIYLLREGELSQVTTDHTFVQRLVDAGRITEEEALVHPRRSVLMRVLGDVDQSPEVDTMVLATRPGDRWLLCSDGLSGVVDRELLRATLMAEGLSAHAVAERLVRYTLDRGAPDNVTVVIYDVTAENTAAEPNTVGSAAKPLAFEISAPRRTSLLPALRLPGSRPAAAALPPVPAGVESDDYYGELLEEDARRVRRRRLTWGVGAIVVLLALLLAGIGGYAWTQSRYFVGESPDRKTVMVFQGVPEDVGPISLSHEFKDTDIQLSKLPDYDRNLVRQKIPADSLDEADAVVSRLRQLSKEGE
ncbi:serine/threonine-protein phosphatase [Mycetocola tolaasinivorans]|uniref:Serine/threonine-protein phosphatase n=1 Tax=Mycetocola tolaasinivorans TaxID=76635 RepID=A0A3L7A4J0_9MICO|nr:protein phosphatase 2C domain-containing protein [Mycetocola tolaasinivorans]RLP75209.1 serine/threonine-protein phosphatase [Mycetocola tolaasinivorans]